MIAYFDTSAVIPLLVEEPGSDRAVQLWEQADRVVSLRIVYAEARAALALARRTGRLSGSALRTTLPRLDELYRSVDRLDIDDGLVRRAGDLAEVHALRGYDALHLAGAERLGSDDAVLVAGDRDLCAAAQELGLAVARTSSDTRGGSDESSSAGSTASARRAASARRPPAPAPG